MGFAVVWRVAFVGWQFVRVLRGREVRGREGDGELGKDGAEGGLRGDGTVMGLEGEGDVVALLCQRQSPKERD